MTEQKKEERYERLYNQIFSLVENVHNPFSRMATIIAVLHHKMETYYWTGFYFLDKGELLVSSYQGPLACLRLKKDTGVCWAGINRKETVIVPDVEAFEGHIACSSASKSEIVVPVRNSNNEVIGVLDVDSTELNSFSEIDAKYLEKIVELIYQ